MPPAQGLPGTGSLAPARDDGSTMLGFRFRFRFRFRYRIS
jgi:hypothetical protein